MTDERTNVEVIAEAISPDRMGWTWKLHPNLRRAGYPMEIDIGPHNILRAIEWAATQGWWDDVETRIQSVHGKYYSPRVYVIMALDQLCAGATIDNTMDKIVEIIASAIQKEIKDGKEAEEIGGNGETHPIT